MWPLLVLVSALLLTKFVTFLGESHTICGSAANTTVVIVTNRTKTSKRDIYIPLRRTTCCTWLSEVENDSKNKDQKFWQVRPSLEPRRLK